MTTSVNRAGIRPAETFQLGELVGYQEGSVVSKTLYDQSAGTVTLFAFDENQGLSPHTSPYDALIQVLEGEAEITISARPNRVRGGELILMPAGQTHALRAVQKFKMLLIMIRSQEERQGAIQSTVKPQLTISQ